MPGMHAMKLPQVRGVLDRLPVKYAALAAIGVTAGCRITEVLMLQRGDLLTRDGAIRDRICYVNLKKRGKAFHHRRLVIPKSWRNYIVRHLRADELRGYDRPDDLVFRGNCGSPLRRQTVWRVFRDVLGKGYGTHWMRKTFAQEMFREFMRTAPADPMRALELTRQALGHARIDTTVRYLGIDAGAVDRAQDAVFSGKGKRDGKRKKR